MEAVKDKVVLDCGMKPEEWIQDITSQSKIDGFGLKIGPKVLLMLLKRN